MIEHVNDTAVAVDFRYEEATILGRTLEAFSSVLVSEIRGDDTPLRLDVVGSMAICYSAMLNLYDAYSCPESVPKGASDEHLVMQKYSIEGLMTVSRRVLDLAQQIEQCGDVMSLDDTSPFVLDCFYQAGVNCE